MKNILSCKIFDCLHWLLLLIVDVGCVIFSFWAGHYLWVTSAYRAFPNPPVFHFERIYLDVLVFLAVMIWGKTYSLESSFYNVLKLKNLIKFSLIGFLAILGVGFFTKTFLLGRLQALYTGAILFFMILATRGLIDVLWNKYVVLPFQHKRLLLYGAGVTGRQVVKAIRRNPKLSYVPIGFLDDEKTAGFQVTTNPLKVLGSGFDLVNVVQDRQIDELWLTMPNANTSHIRNVLSECDKLKLPYKFVPNVNELSMHRVKLENIDGIPLFSTRKLKISPINRLIKRVFDIVFSTFGLLIFLPVFAVIAVLIKRDDPKGPVIFKQKRVGYKGKEFDFYKFRSMYVDAPKYAINPTESDDPRITPIGRFLRRTSLDELPQLWNVLIGTMSLVGPRPEMPFIVEQYYNDVHRERFNVKPGITGIWQISADRSFLIHENIEHDLYYIEHQSLLLDIVIIIQTFFFAIRGVGAW